MIIITVKELYMRRRSKKRDAVYEAVVSTREHPTAAQIYERVRESDKSISLGTVYRNLVQLEESGLIRSVAHTAGYMRYDTAEREHDHFICAGCGRIIDIERDKDTDGMLKALSARLGTSISTLTLNGLCPECKTTGMTEIKSN